MIYKCLCSILKLITLKSEQQTFIDVLYEFTLSFIKSISFDPIFFDRPVIYQVSHQL
jgi:multisubunit Na+/H+ antiporter MnhF subunit